MANNYLQDREEQKRETFTGMGRIFLTHDSCATESMGPIYDRSQEHLGVSDITVIAVRKFLLQCIQNTCRGQRAAARNSSTRGAKRFRHVACIVATIPASKDAKEFVTEQLKKEKYWETAG